MVSILDPKDLEQMLAWFRYYSHQPSAFGQWWAGSDRRLMETVEISVVDSKFYRTLVVWPLRTLVLGDELATEDLWIRNLGSSLQTER